MSDTLLDVFSTFFNALWEGLNNVIIPGTDWNISGFFLALFSAGIIGLILKFTFTSFNSHFGRGASDNPRSETRSRRRGSRGG